MDAISQGWQMGRQTKNLNFVSWEERFAEPIEDLRLEFAIQQPVSRPLAA